MKEARQENAERVAALDRLLGPRAVSGRPPIRLTALHSFSPDVLAENVQAVKRDTK